MPSVAAEERAYIAKGGRTPEEWEERLKERRKATKKEIGILQKQIEGIDQFYAGKTPESFEKRGTLMKHAKNIHNYLENVKKILKRLVKKDLKAEKKASKKISSGIKKIGDKNKGLAMITYFEKMKDKQKDMLKQLKKAIKRWDKVLKTGELPKTGIFDLSAEDFNKSPVDKPLKAIKRKDLEILSEIDRVLHG